MLSKTRSFLFTYYARINQHCNWHFRKGSLIADNLIRIHEMANVNDTLDVLRSSVLSGRVGDLAVDPGYFIYALGGK